MKVMRDHKKAEIQAKIFGTLARMGHDRDLAIRAEFIFQKIRKIKKFRCNHNYLIPAAIYTAARERRTQVNLTALLGQFSDVSTPVSFSKAKTLLFRYYKKIRKELGIAPNPITPEELIPGLSANLRALVIGGQYGKIEEMAYAYLRAADGKIINALPKNLAVAAFFLSALYYNKPLSAKEVADSAGISPLTLRKYAALLMVHIPESWAEVVEDGDVFRCAPNKTHVIDCHHDSQESAAICNIDELRAKGLYPSSAYSQGMGEPEKDDTDFRAVFDALPPSEEEMKLLRKQEEEWKAFSSGWDTALEEIEEWAKDCPSGRFTVEELLELLADMGSG